MRVGIGYDVHRLVAGRPLVLGGVAIESELGLDGHSDADVALHAVMDALLGAAALGLTTEDVSIKATTNERIGFIGRGEGIAALAVATIVATP